MQIRPTVLARLNMIVLSVFVDFSSLASGTEIEVSRYFPFLHLLLLQMCCVTNEIESITLITYLETTKHRCCVALVEPLCFVGFDDIDMSGLK